MHRPLNTRDYKTLALASLGGALEFYDFIIFVFFAAVIGDLFFPAHSEDWLRQLQTYGIFAAGYLARPLGGIIMAHFGDKFGRKRMFALSILLMALPTLLMGLLPTYASIGPWAPILLLVLRIAQGAAIGGEVPGAWVFVAEHVPARKIGYACGTLTAGLTGGILLGSLIATAVNAIWSSAEVREGIWRLPFLLGGGFGLIAMYLRRWLEETPVFTELKARRALSAKLPLKTVLAEHKGGVALSMALTWMLSAAIVVVILMAPTLLQKQFGIAPARALLASCIATLMLSIGCVLNGILVDRFGPGRVLLIGSVLLAVFSSAFYQSLGAAPELLFPLYGLAGLAVGVIGTVPYIMVQSFPPAVRFSGISFSYNVSYAIFGGLTPVLITLLQRWTPLAPSYYVLALCLLGFVIGLGLQVGGLRKSALKPA
ncbi:MFS transporter [Uliginosibacterium sediminicola]|uniref:MFS transporter n=1 Tax=Uliginosibacterium sediminicola TaxID=2024550 RepID=A0ABU9Z3H1_9RHOO